MKYYFAIIIVVLIVVIVLLFFVLFKIYRLHVKSIEEELDLFGHDEEHQGLLLHGHAESKDSYDFPLVTAATDFLNNDLVSETTTNSRRSLDLLDGDGDGGYGGGTIHGKQEIDVKEVQPMIQELGSSESSLESRKSILQPVQPLLKNKAHLKLLLQYDASRSVLKILIKHIDGKLKNRPGSSESYVDMQVSAYRFRTYRNPGYRRPSRSILRKQIEFRLDRAELRTSYLLIFLLRYDPFSRLKVDGEVVYKIDDATKDGLLDGCQVDLYREIVRSNQDFTAFIFRPK